MYDHVQVITENKIMNRIGITVGGYMLEGFGERYLLRMWGQALFPAQQPLNPTGETYDGITVTGETYGDLLASVVALRRGVRPDILRYIMGSVATAIFYAEGAEGIRSANKEDI